ncbi:MAG: 2-isopropylmalate synthase, partial [Nitrososphaerota archaeon]|nr:2-isopropylmalate synthase [Nitrososphaerota archaeon]
ALARAEKEDMDRVIACNTKSIHVFLASSDIHLQNKLHITRQEMVRKTKEAIRYARDAGLTVEFSPEDATRTDPEFFRQVVEAVCEAGAARLDIPDTVGTATPEKMAMMVRLAKSAGDITVSVHCHNDYGLAVANSVAGVLAGADQAHVTVNGIGERAGNTSLEEFIVTCHKLYGMRTNVNLQMLYETSRLVSRITGVVIQPNKAIVGENAFGHESGIHTHGILQNPATYEPFEPSTVGRIRWMQAGKHAGRHGITAQLRGMGLNPKEEHLRLIVDRVKEMGDQGVTVTDGDLYRIASTVMGGKADESNMVRLEDLEVVTGLKRTPSAFVRLVVDGRITDASEAGAGPVDSALNAIQRILGETKQIWLKEYRLEALTGGSDAVADVSVKVEDSSGTTASGRGMKRDIVVASVEAIITGVNALLVKRQAEAAQLKSA